MENLSTFILYLHMACGFTSLLLFWIPAFAKKGGKTHKKVGIYYVYVMSIVALSALILSIENLFTNRISMGVFLGFLSLLTARPLWLGIESLSSKKSLNKRYKIIHLFTSLLLSVAGIVLIWFGLHSSSSLAPVMIIFGILGLTALPELIRMYRTDYTTRNKQWLKDHLSNMIIAGIAAHTAFLVFGGQSILPNTSNTPISIMLWVSPSVIGLFAIAWAKRKYATQG